MQILGFGFVIHVFSLNFRENANNDPNDFFVIPKLEKTWKKEKSKASPSSVNNDLFDIPNGNTRPIFKGYRLAFCTITR